MEALELFGNISENNLENVNVKKRSKHQEECTRLGSPSIPSYQHNRQEKSFVGCKYCYEVKLKDTLEVLKCLNYIYIPFSNSFQIIIKKKKFFREGNLNTIYLVQPK